MSFKIKWDLSCRYKKVCNVQEHNITDEFFNQVNGALNLDHTLEQWVDLGIHTEACMTRPQTCDAAGGAISVWVNGITCLSFGGIISSQAYGSSGTNIYCSSFEIRYDLDTKIMLWIYLKFKPKYVFKWSFISNLMEIPEISFEKLEHLK